MRHICNEFVLNRCSGCGACINKCPCDAIQYSTNSLGFLIPKVDENKCISCGLCVSVCPFKHEGQLGKTIKSFAGLCIDENDRVNSSSGGIFPVIAKYVLKNDGIVFGAEMDSDFIVKHTYITKTQDLKKLQKSKYVQSNTEYTFRKVLEYLKKEKLVLYCGTPCQIAGLKRFIPENYKTNLITIDLVCHGVPNQEIFHDYLENIEKNSNKKIVSYIFRDKRKLRNGMSCFFSYSFNDSKYKYIKNWPEDSYNYFYMKGYIYRDSCYSCPFTRLKRPGDFTLCDFWGWSNYSNKFNKHDTVSGILINTDKGIKLFNKMSSNMCFIECDLQDIVANNSCLVKPTNEPLRREELLLDWKKNGYSYIDNKFREENHWQIFKYSFLRKIPDILLDGARLMRKFLTKFK